MRNILDEFNQACLAIKVDRRLNANNVIGALSDPFILRGAPGFMRFEKGPEFAANASSFRQSRTSGMNLEHERTSDDP